MSSTYAKIRKELAAQSEPDNRLPCLTCSKPTLREMLAQYGGRCFTCGQSYCREPFVQREPSAAARKLRAEIAEKRR